MLSNKDPNLVVEEKTPIVRPGTYSPITVHMGDTMGVLFLGILTCILLVRWGQAEERYRKLTAQDGEGWGLAHVRRVMELAGWIGVGIPHDALALSVAVALHDWGAFPRYRVPGLDHALRSRQIAETDILPRMGLSPSVNEIVLEAIEKHDYRDLRPMISNEALLLREADMLDLIGMVGIAREFAWGPNDLDICQRRIHARLEGVRGRLTLPRAKEIAHRVSKSTCAGFDTPLSDVSIRKTSGYSTSEVLRSSCYAKEINP